MRDPLRAVIRRGFGRLVAPDAKIRFFAFYNVDGASASARERFIKRVRRGISGL
jgi:hypothetical protein